MFASTLCTWIRFAVFAGIVWLVHDRYRWDQAQQRGAEVGANVSLENVRKIFPDAGKLGDWNPETGGRTVLDEFGYTLGYALQTSPASDSVIGYSGPTNMLIGFDTANTVLGVLILKSGDTQEHVQAVQENEQFLKSFAGKTWEQLQQPGAVDGVSGATLTSIAIVEGIAKRLGGNRPSLRFPRPIHIEEAQKFFPAAATIRPSTDRPGMNEVLDEQKKLLGYLARTSPYSDEIIGYQGPTDVVVALDLKNQIAGFAVHDTYETEQYVDYIRKDDYFVTTLNGRAFETMPTLDLGEAKIEGVSGATLTSLAMVRAMMAAAEQLTVDSEQPTKPLLPEFSPRDLGTLLVVLVAVLLGMTTLRAKHWVRFLFQMAVIGYLGFVAGDFVSQALLVGWAQHGVPWQNVPGLAILTGAALLVPPLTKRQLYCHHICPHGAVQQIVKNRLPWRLRLPRLLQHLLATVPGILLGVCLFVAMTPAVFNLANLEPFDAYVFWVAGWGSIAVAATGLLFSLFVPMGYCRYGCPTGAVLSYVRHHAHANRFTRQDAFACMLLLTAFGLWWR